MAIKDEKEKIQFLKKKKKKKPNYINFAIR